ncbi:zinc finger, CCHC-type containing protein [Tanacetum coccineum]
MAVVAMKHMASNFVKLDKFERVDFRRLQKKMHFFLSSMSVVYVLNTPIPEDDGDDATVKKIRKRAKWDNDDYDSLEAKYMAEDASSKKFLVSCIIDKLPPSWKDFKHKKQELTLVELGSHLCIEESLRAQDSDKPKGNNVVGRGCVDLRFSSGNIVSLFNVLHVPNIRKKFGFKWFCYVYLLHTKDEALNKFKVFKTEVELQQGFMIKRFRTNRRGEYMDTLYFQSVGIIYETTAPYTPQQNGISERKNRVLKEIVNSMLSYSERGIECIFVGYAEHSKAFRFYIIKPNDSVSIISIIESRDAIFDENRFSSVPRPSLRIPNGSEDIGGLVVSEEVTKEDGHQTFDEAMKSHDVAFWKESINDETDSIMGKNTLVLADLPPGCKPLGCKWIFKRKLKVDGTIEKFKVRLVIHGFKQKSGIDYFDTYALVARIKTIRLLIAMASIHNLIIHQMDVKTAFLNGELDEEVYMNQPQGFIMLGNENKVDLTKEFWSSRFSMKDMEEADVILVSTPMDTSEKLMSNNGQAVSQLEYSRVIGCLMYAMTCTRLDIAFAIRNTKDNSSTSGWVFLLGGGAISWAFKKQSCITGSTMESEFLALATAGKEAEWFRNLILEIPLWSKPIAPIFIRCDSAATLAKAYSQMYNRKSRHLSVRHSLIRELITNGVISIEFVRSQQNLVDHFTKGLARDLVIKSAEGIRLKSNKVTDC